MRALRVATVLLAVVGLGVSLFLSVAYGFHCLDGDGGVPFVARDSAQKDVCGATGNGLVLFVLMGVAAGAVVLLTLRLIDRWQAGRTPLALCIAAIAGIPLAPLVPYALANSPSDSCTDEQLAAVDEWEAQGERGDPPHDCDVY